MSLSIFKPQSQDFDFCSFVNEIQAKGIHIVGFEFDGTACFRKGTRLGPDDIRVYGKDIELYSPYLDMDLEEKNLFYDLGNLKNPENYLEAIENFHSFLKRSSCDLEKQRFLFLGGEHSISYAPIVPYLEQFKDLVLIHLDAHADLRDGYEGYKYSHASIIKRVLDHFGKDHKLFQYGIRSGTKEEFSIMRSQNFLIDSLDSLCKKLQLLPDETPIYLTLDLDFFDPAYLPGTGTPEAGGETFHSFIKIMKILKTKKLVGADVVELAPEIDSSRNSSVFAVKVVREILLAMSQSL